MEFLIRPAAEADLPVLFSIMEQGLASVPKGWFAGETMEFLQTHLSGQGFILLAQAPDGTVAGYFAARFPKDAPDNLGLDVGLPEEELPLYAKAFYGAMAEAGLAMIDYAARFSRERAVVLSGRLFQDGLLSDMTAELLTARGYTVYQHEKTPADESGVCIGQAYAAGMS